MTLNDLELNESAIVRRINGSESFVNRLINIGFSLDTEIKCVLISPFKNPKAYLINNILIAIRNEDAKNIEVSYE